MAGANYMGGKRNVAKARSKDAASRVQKGFFGRKRLDLLAKGLAASSRGLGSIPVKSGRAIFPSGIDLAHARRHSVTTEASHNYMQCCTEIFPQPSSSSAARKTRSKVLDALDTTQPLFIRAAMDRILALPDLAGLSKSQYTPSPNLGSLSKRPRTQVSSHSPSPNRSKRQKTTLQKGYLPTDSAGFSFVHGDYSNSDSRPSDASECIYLDPGTSLDAYFSDHDPSLSLTVPALHKSIERKDTIEMKNFQDAEDEDFEPMNFDDSTFYDDSGYSEFGTGLLDYQTSPLHPGSDEHAILVSSPSAFGRDQFCSQNSILDLDTSLPGSSVSSQAVLTPSNRSSSSSLGLWLPQIPEPCAPPPRLSRSGFIESSHKPIASTPRSIPFGLLPKSVLPEVAPLVPSPPSNPLSLFVLGSRQGESRVACGSGSSRNIDPPPPIDRFEVEGNLLDHDDPWGVIGKLLGFEKSKRMVSGATAPPLEGLVANDRRGVGYVATRTDQPKRHLYDVDEINDRRPPNTLDFDAAGRPEVTDELPSVRALGLDTQPNTNTNVLQNDNSSNPRPLEPIHMTVNFRGPKERPKSEHPKPLSFRVTENTKALGPCLFFDRPVDSDDDDN